MDTLIRPMAAIGVVFCTVWTALESLSGTDSPFGFTGHFDSRMGSGALDLQLSCVGRVPWGSWD